jgi:hypothetical protein
MIQPRAADDFAKISARMKVLRRERERADAAESELPSDPPAELDIGRSERSNCAANASRAPFPCRMGPPNRRLWDREAAALTRGRLVWIACMRSGILSHMAIRPHQN